MAKPHRLLWLLFPTYLLMVVLSLAGVLSWIAADEFRSFYYNQVARDLEARVKLVAFSLEPRWGHGRPEEFQKICQALGAQEDMRITLILPDGRVLADSQAPDPLHLENHASRPEVQAALHGPIGIAQRHSYTLDQEMMYVAMPLIVRGERAVIVRVAVPLVNLSLALNSVYGRMVLGTLVIAFLAALLSLLVSRRLSIPLERIKQGAQQFAQGHFSHKLVQGKIEELNSLAGSLNQMASQLDDRFRTILRQQNEQDAVFAAMIESVLVVDQDEKLVRMNPAAVKLFTLDPVKSVGRPIQEIIRNPELQLFVQLILSHSEPQEAEILLSAQEQRIMWASGSRLLDENRKNTGALVVLNDLSRQQKLENVRREFVANVSHELKTPVTLIQGYIETLLDGALEKPKEARRFLNIILESSRRLQAIIEDLLSLSRIEQLEDQAMDYDVLKLAPILQRAAETLALQAKEKMMAVEIQCPPDLAVNANATLLEQAMINLIDNAIKYSDPKSAVQVLADVNEHQVIIRVKDTGCGIVAEHLPRLFERFYRVDKSRSRNASGTGLGLAIVKHIVQVHGGEVRVESQPGQGSTFTIILPVQAPA